MPTYDAGIDTSYENNSHTMMIHLVGSGVRVLDIGCATGYLARALQERGCQVSGVEYDPTAAALAREDLDEVLEADLETVDLVTHFGAGSFDVVVIGDVLEHLRNPLDVLTRITGLLRPGGSVVISVPNVAHGSVRLALLQGDWTYRERGLLDETHVHFFTRNTILRLVQDAGLLPLDVLATTLDPLSGEVAVDPSNLPPGVIEWVREQPDSQSYQFVIRAVRNTVEAGIAIAVKERDEFADENQDLHAVVERQDRELSALTERAAAAEADLSALLQTRSYRLLRLPRSAYSRLRRSFDF